MGGTKSYCYCSCKQNNESNENELRSPSMKNRERKQEDSRMSYETNNTNFPDREIFISGTTFAQNISYNEEEEGFENNIDKDAEESKKGVYVINETENSQGSFYRYYGKNGMEISRDLICREEIPRIIISSPRENKYRSYIDYGCISAYISSSLDSQIGVWGGKRLEKIEIVKTGIEYTKCIQIGDGRIAGGKLNGDIDIRELPSLALQQTLSSKEYGCRNIYISALLNLSQGELASGGSLEGDILIWDIQSGEVVEKMLHAHTKTVNVLTVGDTYIFSGGNDGRVCIWNLSTKHLLRTFHLTYPVLDILSHSYIPQSTIFILTSNQIYLPNLQNELLPMLNVDKHNLTACFLLNSHLILFGDSYGGLLTYNLLQERTLNYWEKVHSRRIISIDYGGEGRVITASWDSTFKLLDLTTQTVIATNTLHTEPITAITTIYAY